MSLKRHILRHIAVQEQAALEKSQVETVVESTLDVISTEEIKLIAETPAAVAKEAPPEPEVKKKPAFSSKKKTTIKSS